MGRIARTLCLIDDNYHPNFGWEFDNRGLAKEKRECHAQWDFVKVHAEYDSLLSRKFRKQTSGKVTLEANFVIDCPNGFALYITDDNENTAFGVTTNDNKFSVIDGIDTQIPVIGGGARNQVKAVCDLDNKEVLLIVNNEFAGTFPLSSQIDNINYIHIGILKGYTGLFYGRGIKLYAGYNLYERFLTPITDIVPYGWIFETEDGYGKTISTPYNRASTDQDTFFFEMSSNGGKTCMSKDIESLSGESCFEIKFLEHEGSLDAVFGLGEFEIYAKNGKILLNDGTEVCEYLHNFWNALRLEFVDDKMIVRLNGRDRGEYSAKAPEYDNVKVTVSGNCVMRIDDIYAFALAPLPEDYVPTPIPAESKGYHVCMMSFMAWHFGDTWGPRDAGWDCCTAFDESEPYLGYYDEGIPEVSDWDTKWFCEHGIDFQLQCWYGPKSISEPLKLPGHYHWLHDGYFNSVYKNYSKFALMWETAFTQEVPGDSFEKYFVPYFIEYYFKNPGYYCIDGMPVFSIYSLDHVARYFGGVEQARKKLDYFREEVKKAGFKGLIILASGSCTYDGQAEFREALGLEGSHLYALGEQAFTASYQIGRLTHLKNNVPTCGVKTHKQFPTASSGYNTVARFDTPPYPYITPEEFEKVLLWIKDVYLKDEALFPDQNSWESKLVFLDNWNEFDEGHYLSPAKLHGFGYVEAIRRVFTNSPDHVNIRPTENQKKRINVMYPEGHAWLRPERQYKDTEEPKVVEVVKRIDFDTPEKCGKWSAGKNAYKLEYANGVLLGYSNGMDPQIISDKDIDFDADKVTHIRVRQRVLDEAGEKTNCYAMLYYCETAEEAFSSRKGLSVDYVTDENGDFSNIYFAITPESREKRGFNGIVRKLRYDASEVPGTFEIESIEMLRCEPKKQIKVCVDGEETRITLPSTAENGEVYVPFHARCKFINNLDMTYRWNKEKSQIVVIYGEKELEFTKDSDVSVLFDNETGERTEYKLDKKVFFVDKVPALPMKFVSGIFGLGYSFDGDTLNITQE